LNYDEFRMALEAARSQFLVRQYQTEEGQTQREPKRLTSWWRRQ
jgi:hypothetical protein